MTEMTSRQILDAIDRTLEEISLRFAKEAVQPISRPTADILARSMGSVSYKQPEIAAEISKVSP